MNLEPPEFLTPELIAQFCGVSPSTVRRWIQSGELVASNLGGWKIRPADFNEFILARTPAAKRESEVAQ